MTTRLPKGWKSPTLDRYDGTSDPDEHINAYVAQLSIYTTDTHVYYKVFPASLRGMTLSWFTQLPPKSIDSFENLKTKFAAQFATNKPHNLTPIALANVRQEKGESLQTFMDRFGQVALNIRGLLSEVAMVYLTTALRSGPFADSLAMQPAASMEELSQRAAQFMHVEELQEFKTHTRADQAQARQNDRDRNPQKAREFPLPSRFAKYTPLNAGRARILEEALSTELIPAPRKFPSPPRADQTKHCRYHRNHDHSTEECIALKDKIEELIQAGHL